MTARLSVPVLPEGELLADLRREAANRERLQRHVVEKESPPRYRWARTRCSQNARWPGWDALLAWVRPDDERRLLSRSRAAAYEGSARHIDCRPAERRGGAPRAPNSSIGREY